MNDPIAMQAEIDMLRQENFSLRFDLEKLMMRVTELIQKVSNA